MKSSSLLTFVLVSLACEFAAPLAQQSLAQQTGGITPEMLKTITTAGAADKSNAADKALRNAVAAISIDELAVNRDHAAPIDTRFSVETAKQAIHDQKSSGRCWMFSGMNVLRGRFAKMHNDTLAVAFSQDYLFFWDQLEKANLFLQGIIDCADQSIDDQRVRFFFQHPTNDGGTFCGVADLAAKYGLVPQSVMPETYSSDNTSRMAKLISSKLREYGLALREKVQQGAKAKALNEQKTQMLAEVYRMLTLTLGVPPTEFDYAFADKDGKPRTAVQHYTPLSFYEAVGGGFDFIMVMNDPRRPYYKTYEVQWDRHTYDGHNWRYLNLPMDEIEQMAIASLRDGQKMYSSYDVAKQLDRKRGYADLDNYDYASLMGTTFGMDKAQRIMTFDSGSTHAMTLVAVDLDSEGKALKWKVENSWGAAWGEKGCLIMTDRWLREYMFRLVVDTKYVPANLLQMNQQPPTLVEPEDPLFLPDE